MFSQNVLDKEYEEKDFNEQMDFYVRWRMFEQMKQLKEIQDQKRKQLDEQGVRGHEEFAKVEDYDKIYNDKRFQVNHCFDENNQLQLMNITHEGPESANLAQYDYLINN